MDMSLTVLSMFDTNFIYFSVAIDFRVALGLALPCIPSLSHCADNCGSPSCSPATLISLPCSLTRGCAENLFSVLAIWNSHFVPLLFFSLARRHPSHSHASTQASQPTKLSVRPHSRRPKSTPLKDQGTKGLEHYCVGRYQKQPGTSNQPPEPSRDLPGTTYGLLMMDAPQDNKSHDPLALPAPEVLAEIARKQDARAAEIRAARAARRHSKVGGSVSEEQTRNNAALLIQKNYRGHRTRRAIQGRGLDPSVRWIEALKEGAL
jgi:hypothetical protein